MESDKVSQERALPQLKMISTCRSRSVIKYLKSCCRRSVFSLSCMIRLSLHASKINLWLTLRCVRVPLVALALDSSLQEACPTSHRATKCNTTICRRQVESNTTKIICMMRTISNCSRRKLNKLLGQALLSQIICLMVAVLRA